MSHAAEIRVLVIFHFGDWDGKSPSGIGLGHLSPSETLQFAELLGMKTLRYEDHNWRVKGSTLEIDAGIPILRITFYELPEEVKTNAD